MTKRGLWAAVGVALAVGGCGASQTGSPSSAVHLDGKRAPGNYVVETDASGVRFLVPTPLLAGQGSQSFDVAAPTKVTIGEAKDQAIAGAPPYRVGVASTTAVVPHSAHIEILATGSPGRRFELSWEETCGWTQQGAAAVGGTGGNGRAVLRSPAVMLVNLPRTHGGVDSCYLAVTASATTAAGHVRLMIIDY